MNCRLTLAKRLTEKEKLPVVYRMPVMYEENLAGQSSTYFNALVIDVPELASALILIYPKNRERHYSQA